MLAKSISNAERLMSNIDVDVLSIINQKWSIGNSIA
jgi:hypothetical protein